jgi:predicted phage tail protein
VPLLPAPVLAGLPALNDRATLRWQFAAVDGAAAYRHQLARDASFRALVSDVVTTTPASELPDLADGRYWLRVRAIDGAAIEGFDATVELEQRWRLDAPTATAPVGGAKRLGERVRFDWAALPGAGGYRFQLATEASFASPLVERRVDAAAQAATAGTELAAPAPGRYWWRVAAIDAAGVVGHWGEPQVFEQKPPPVAAEPVSAVGLDGARTQTFRWAATEPGQQFEWELAADPAFRKLLRSGRSASPELCLEALPYGAHYLRVRAIDADGFTAPFGPGSRVEVPVPSWVWFLTPAILLIPVL